MIYPNRRGKKNVTPGLRFDYEKILWFASTGVTGYWGNNSSFIWLPDRGIA